MKKRLLLTSLILSSMLAGSAYAYDNTSSAGPAPQKIAVMDDIIKDVIKQSIQTIGTKIMDKYLVPGDNSYQETTPTTYDTQDPNTINNSDQSNEQMIPVQ